jgi:hypothetical protein
MTDWTLRLVACAALVALLGRLPAVASVTLAFGVGLAATAALLLVALVVVGGASFIVARHRRPVLTPAVVPPAPAPLGHAASA